jgi:hypothetical protein
VGQAPQALTARLDYPISRRQVASGDRFDAFGEQGVLAHDGNLPRRPA